MRIDGLWEILEAYSIIEVVEAIEWAKTGLEYFPRPVDFLRRIKANRQTRAVEEEATRRATERLEWREPTAEGRQKAKEIVGSLYKKWEEEDARTEEQRQEEFEKKRAILQKQARLLRGEG